MWGNDDVEGVILDILIQEYDHKRVIFHEIDFSDAIYSNGFISAIERGAIPQIEGIHPSYQRKREGEYHHLIFNDECYCVYFKDDEDE